MTLSVLWENVEYFTALSKVMKLIRHAKLREYLGCVAIATHGTRDIIC